jgi:hypothetical protein
MELREKQTIEDNSVEITQFRRLAEIGLIVFGLLGLSLWVSPYVFTGDPAGLTRYVLLKTPIALVSIFLIILSGCIFDSVTPGDSLKTIACDPMASAILYAALFVALSITMAFG